MAELTRTLYQTVARDVFGSTTLRLADGSESEIGGEWAQISLFGAVSEALGEEISPAMRSAELLRRTERAGLEVHPGWLPGKLVEELFEHLVLPDLRAPTLVKDFPVDTSPLTREHRSAGGLVEKWDLNIKSVESATAYSELVDRVVQRERFEAQAAPPWPVLTRRCRSTRTSWCDGVRNAAERRHGNGDQPAAHGAHGCGYP